MKDLNQTQLVNSEDRQGVEFTRILINNSYPNVVRCLQSNILNKLGFATEG